MLSVQSLSVRYKQEHVFSGLSVDFSPGVVGVLGPNGAGKTTLVKVLSTALSPDSGDVMWCGRSTFSDMVWFRRQLAVLPQATGFVPHFSVAEFVEYCGWLRGMTRREARALTPEAVDRLGLGGSLKTQMKNLSGGMQRRVGIAATLMGDPPLAILDEPTTGLDVDQRIAFREVLRQRPANSLTLLSTHLAEDVSAGCTHAVVIGGGKVLFDGTPAALAEKALASSPGDSPLERGYTAVLSGVAAS